MARPRFFRTAARFASTVTLLAIGAVLLTGCGGGSETGTTKGGDAAANNTKPVTLLNVSYDPTRELYRDFNQAFAEHWKATTGQTVTIDQSHGGSGKQARAVIEGLEADVVTLALAYDIDAIAAKSDLLPKDWQQRLEHNSAPYTSTIVFLVRKGNPKGIKNWDDLVQGDIKIITPNPKTSGGARWNYLAAWGFVLQRELGDLKKLNDPAEQAAVAAAQAKAKEFVGEIFKRVPVLDSGARGSTNTFVQNGQGDVLLAWENEAFLAVKELGPEKFEIVVPSVSILAEPPVSLVDKNADKRGTRKVAEGYLEFLYSKQGQQLAAKNYYRPAKNYYRPAKHDAVAAEDLAQFVNVKLFTIDEAFGGWSKAQPEHFDDGGVFDQLYQPAK